MQNFGIGHQTAVLVYRNCVFFLRLMLIMPLVSSFILFWSGGVDVVLTDLVLHISPTSPGDTPLSSVLSLLPLFSWKTERRPSTPHR